MRNNQEGVAVGELEGKVAVVTGGASGIGSGTARKFVAEGARVVIADVDRERGESIATELGPAVRFQHTDVSKPDEVARLVGFAVETFGGLHVMFNNAGISGVKHRSILDNDYADFHQVMGVNLLGVVSGTREAGRHMAANGGGSIINISSIGALQPPSGTWTYRMSKASVIMFSQSAALELGRYNIRVNCIAPGNIETPILERTMVSHLPDDERAAAMARIRGHLISRQAIPMQGTTDHLADAAIFLASERSAFVTGVLMPVDGGLVLGGTGPTSEIDRARQVGG